MKTFFRLLHFVQPYRWLVIWALFFGAVFSALSALSIAIVQPIFQLLFDNVSLPVSSPDSGVLSRVKDSFYSSIIHFIGIGETKSSALIRLGVLIIFIFILKNISKYCCNILTTLLNENLIRSIRERLFTKMLHFSMDFFTAQKGGHLVSIITNDVAAVQGSVTAATLALAREPLQIVLFLLMLVSLSPFLTLVAFGTSICALLLIRIATKTLRRYAERMQTVMSNFTSVLQETLGGIRIVKAFSMEERVINLFTMQTRGYVRAASKYQRVYDIVPATSEIFAIIALSVVLYVGGQQVFSGEMRSHELITFLFALFSIMSPITNVVSLPAQVQRGLVAAETVFGILDREPTVENGTQNAPNFEQEIRVDNVQFAYQKGRSVLSDISFSITKGRKIALVGGSGSGKSTMCDLLIRLYDPSEGHIFLDGTDIRQFTFASYRRFFGVVSQESLLFNDTIANNIRFGSMGVITDSQVHEAARIANAAEFIEKLPDGYNTFIGDRGVLLSGGQKQRLAIARALVGNPAILVFDEATSALDSESERLVQEAINNVLEDRTAIIIAHRLSTIVSADEILVFNEGRIIERGNHTELLAKKGMYSRLYDIQFGTP
ncbi:MAG: ABC transporter ATP-binding protein [Candidatus Kapabacteria bacterium]|nr:ABC transporter ATP-binding protein [Candidatus Kapabacteria bacterium]